jgi:cytochrome c oxidase subunit 2
MNLTPTNIFSPAAAPAVELSKLSVFVMAVTGAIFLIVGALIFIAAIRFRRRHDDDGREPAQFFGANQLEIAWTIIPILIVLVLSLSTARVIQTVQPAKRPADAIDVTVVGHQWWWEVHYPALGVVTANELHIPVSDPHAPMPTWLTLLSADVAHSFWVPRLAGKIDLIPNRVNHLLLAPSVPGVYLGQCAEFCGTQHAKMLLRVYVHSREEFARWATAQADPKPTADPVAAGRRVFEASACVNCHALAGTIANGRYAPDLTHLMSRYTLASGAAALTPRTLRAWIRNPDNIKPGSHMPSMKLGDHDLDDLVQYLLTLR